MEQQEYKVELDVFEGPLDLLLYLIKRDEIEIDDIPIEKITTQYLKYLDLFKMMDLNVAGEFIVMAAQLLQIKSRMLLPPIESGEVEDEDPRDELVKRLIEYKRFKEAADMLQDKEEEQEGIFTRLAKPDIEFAEEEKLLIDASIFDLITAFEAVFERADDETMTEIFEDEFSVGDKIAEITNIVDIENNIKFSELFMPNVKKAEVFVTFVAILELIKQGTIAIKQEKIFGEIIIYKKS